MSSKPALELSTWCELPTPMGTFRMYDSGDDLVRIVSLGDLHEQGVRPLVRVHSSCLASEVFAARDCDCADQLRESMKLIASESRGIILHLHQEGRGHGLALKIKAVGEMQRARIDTVAAFESLGMEQDIRSYEAAVRILRVLKVSAVRLITNNPRKRSFLESAGIQADMVPTHPTVRAENREYLEVKNVKLGHRIPFDSDHETSTIRFYHSDQPWGALSNFSPHAIFLRRRIWPSVEHYYQAQKFAGQGLEERIRSSETPMLAKRRAQELASRHRRVDWDSVKDQVMLEGLRAKFQQHPDLHAMLLRSGERTLVEHTKHDVYWGDGGDGRGENRLGQLLMKVRAELRRQPLELGE